ncbi:MULTISPECIES: phosphate ABC transporter permease PstA [unclassified Oleiphilus]|nr:MULTISPECIES: phosphate ABC transporter permease PstA [unclassified Oleiphilus]
MRVPLKKWFKDGDPWVWLNAGAVAISLVMVFSLLILIASRGLVHFWAHDVVEADVENRNGGTYKIMGELVETESVSAVQLREAGYKVPQGVEFMDRHLLKMGNRDVTGSDFRWVLDASLSNRHYPEDIIAMERREWGNFYGYLKDVKESGQVVASGNGAWDELSKRIERALSIHDEIYTIEKAEIGSINSQIERLRLKERSYELNNELTAQRQLALKEERAALDNQYKGLQSRLSDLYTQINRDSLVATTADGQEREIEIAHVVRAFQPNKMSLAEKISFYIEKLVEFVSDDPREANTEGGIFPAIYGTVLMVIVMSIMVTPLGVIAAVYLREYAHQGAITRIIRIAVNNLAGVPSIVYGVFGLGFFIYFLGSGIDQAFFPEALPAPTLGTGGLLWASVTLAILTLPVVIVATEEGLSRIPRSIREGSLALGATKAETLWRVVLPMASPAMMTGVILAIARAAGEVAPLMLVGVVKLAPSLPLDGNYPYLHLDQKFMHLGFHIYDVGFQSPNVEAARPLVYATSLLLVIVIAMLNLSAVAIRNKLREKYKALEV